VRRAGLTQPGEPRIGIGQISGRSNYGEETLHGVGASRDRHDSRLGCPVFCSEFILALGELEWPAEPLDCASGFGAADILSLVGLSIRCRYCDM
jgi:hypothetical protein